MNLNFETPKSLWSYFLKYFPDPSALIGQHEDPTHIPRKIEDHELVSEAFETTYKKLESELRQTISSISTYHACRVIDESSYRTEGIKKLRVSEATEWMKDFFQLKDKVDEAVEALGQKLSGYGDWNGSGVFTMCSKSDSEKRKLAYKEGSEFIRRTAEILGPKHLEKYKSTGRPCYIETRVPLSWFEENTDRNDLSGMIRYLLSHWILTETNNHYYAKDRMNFAVIYSADIPVDMIHHFHYSAQEPTSR
tara:strand:- start:271 stop:1020 length:750 start_codon:yes stop_codon:yes gene_type:complete